MKAGEESTEGDGRIVAQRRNVKGEGFSREGQNADVMQVVDGVRSCRQSSVVTDTRSVSRLYNGTPSLVSGCARRRMAAPNP